ncbi:MAG: 50S ribosomal protein L18a [Thermoplasmata archaeon]|nr:50S ribosomal protein L18a [Thermoplasmata archaeon]
MKIFRITGTFKMGPHWQNFTKEAIATNEKAAVERLYSDIGGKHRLKRTEIKIGKVKAISPDEVTDLVLNQMIEHKMVDL